MKQSRLFIKIKSNDIKIVDLAFWDMRLKPKELFVKEK